MTVGNSFRSQLMHSLVIQHVLLDKLALCLQAKMRYTMSLNVVRLVVYRTVVVLVGVGRIYPVALVISKQAARH